MMSLTREGRILPHEHVISCKLYNKPYPLQMIDRNMKIEDIYSNLIVFFGFIFPFSVAVGNIVAALITLLWIFRGNHKENWASLKGNRFVVATLCFVALHFAGMLWTTDIESGIRTLQKESVLLLIPVFMLFIQKKHLHRYIFAFLISISCMVIVSFAIYYGIIPPLSGAKQSDPTPFMSHISYNPFLTIAIYLLLFFILFDNTQSKRNKFVYLLVTVIFSINMFITKGRAGQAMFFVMIFITTVQYFNKQRTKGLLAAAILIPLILSIAYSTSDNFRNRINAIVSDVQKYQDNNKKTSTGLRFVFADNSFEIIRNNPVFGVGTGDFAHEYETINKKNTPGLRPTENPHNMYVLTTVQLGMIGLVSLFSLLFFQIQLATSSKIDFQKKFGLTLPILFGIIMLSDSYLRGQFTTMLYVYLSSFTYKVYE